MRQSTQIAGGVIFFMPKVVHSHLFIISILTRSADERFQSHEQHENYLIAC